MRATLVYTVLSDKLYHEDLIHQNCFETIKPNTRLGEHISHQDHLPMKYQKSETDKHCN